MRFAIPTLSRGVLGIAALAAAAAWPAPAPAADDAEAIMRDAHLNMYYAGDDGRAIVQMDLVDKRGKTRNRTFVMIRKDTEDGGEQKYFTYFFEPNDKGSSFVGSDFSYEDVSGRHWSDDTHTLVREEELDGRPTWVIESVPKEEDSFSKKLTWVDKEVRLPLREEYYDDKGELERVFRAEKVETVDGFPTVTVRSMENVKKDHKTTVTFTETAYDVGVSDDMFTERRLKNPPSELVKR